MYGYILQGFYLPAGKDNLEVDNIITSETDHTAVEVIAASK